VDDAQRVRFGDRFASFEQVAYGNVDAQRAALPDVLSEIDTVE
jgi:hypothetical protein